MAAKETAVKPAAAAAGAEADQVTLSGQPVDESHPGNSPQPADPMTAVSSIVPDVADPDAQAVGTAKGAVVNDAQTARNKGQASAGPAGDREARVEQYDATAADGSTVRVEHNIDTGETRVVS